MKVFVAAAVDEYTHYCFQFVIADGFLIVVTHRRRLPPRRHNLRPGFQSKREARRSRRLRCRTYSLPSSSMSI